MFTPISYPRKPYYHLSHLISISIFLLSFFAINDNEAKAIITSVLQAKEGKGMHNRTHRFWTQIKYQRLRRLKNRTKDNGTQTKYGLRDLRVRAFRD